MCLIVLAWKTSPQYKLLLAANRDEYLDRPTMAASFQGDMLAGKDLQAGGTWLGVTRAGRVAAVTNFRSADSRSQTARSRGLLVSDFLAAECSVSDYLLQLVTQREQFNPFNLLLYDGQELVCYNSMTNQVDKIEAGVYALSNHSLDSRWPKQERIKQSLKELLDVNTNIDTEVDTGVDTEELFTIMADTEPAEDSDLPETGVSLEWERRLSSIFISGEDYATRSTSVLTLDHQGQCQFVEKTYPQRGQGEISCSKSFILAPGISGL